FKDPSARGQTFIGPFRFNDRGEIAFNARLTGSTSASGLYRADRDHATTIALAGTIAPGTNGTFQSFRDFQLEDDDRVAVIATLAIGVGDVDASNNMGIWIGTSDDDLRLVVRTGEVIGGRTLTSLPQFGQGNRFSLNDDGIVWIGGFGPSVTAIVVSRVPSEER